MAKKGRGGGKVSSSDRPKAKRGKRQSPIESVERARSPSNSSPSERRSPEPPESSSKPSESLPEPSESPPKPSGNPKPSENPRPIIIGGEKYFKASDVAGKRKGKKRTSVIWDHGFEIVHVKTEASYFYCKTCLDDGINPDYKPLVINGTSSILTHVQSIHETDKDLGSAVDRASPARPSPGPGGRIFQHTLDKFRSLLIQWIVYCHIAFSQLENNYFRRLLTFLNPPLGNFLPSGVTFRKWVLAEFRTQKETVKKELKSARSNIHLSFDLWTSPNAYSIIAVISHFIDSKGRRQTKLLAVRRVLGEHSGENMGACVFQVIREYGIRKRIGFLVLDNVASNDVIVDYILRKAYPGMGKEARKRRRIRCLCHVTNLVAKAFLLGSKEEM